MPRLGPPSPAAGAGCGSPGDPIATHADSGSGAGSAARVEHSACTRHVRHAPPPDESLDAMADTNVPPVHPPECTTRHCARARSAVIAGGPQVFHAVLTLWRAQESWSTELLPVEQFPNACATEAAVPRCVPPKGGGRVEQKRECAIVSSHRQRAARGSAQRAATTKNPSTKTCARCVCDHDCVLRPAPTRNKARRGPLHCISDTTMKRQ